MQPTTVGRRLFMKRSGAIILTGLPAAARAQSAADTRLDWNRFRSSPDYASLINGMAGLRSPDDPVFWLHQANLDRLWTAWMRAGAGRQVPAPGEPYWSGQLDYADGPQATALLRDSGALGYRYADETLPAALADKAEAQSFLSATPAADSAAALPGMAIVWPQLSRSIAPFQALQFRSAAGTVHAIDASHIALASARGIVLAQSDVTVELALDANISEALQRLFSAQLPFAGTAHQSLQIVLDNLQLLESGAGGGYYYALYLNLPPATDTALAQQRYLLGSLGAFEIAAARQRMQRGLAGSVRIAFAATGLQRQLANAPLRGLALSFIRVNGANSAPSGEMISIGELRLELALAAAA
jgi:tyrosinase